ncbi:MAG: hypothetical protein ACRDGG_04150, partial [Anaerolineae bacterium]
VYGAVLIRSTRYQHARAAVGLAGVTFVMYLLWSKGYSPQWSLHLMAFLCILMPNLRGVLLLIVLEALYVIEWPITFILLKADAGYLTALVVVRTLVMVGLGLLFGAMIFVKQEWGWQRLRSASMAGSLAALLAVIGLAIGGLPLYASQRNRAEPMRDAIDLIRSTSTPDRAAVLFDRVDTYERLAPYLPGWPTLAGLRIGGAADEWSDARLQSFAAERSELWVVIDFGAEQHRQTGDAIDRRLSESLCLVSRQFAGAARVSRYVSVEPTTDLNVSTEFEDNIKLENVRTSSTAVGPGEPICVELEWMAAQTPSTDYIVFVHLLDSNNQVVAQSDVSPGSGFAPTTAWLPSQAIVDRHGLIVPAAVAPGMYRLTAGLYDLEGTRLPVRSTAGTPATDSFLLGTLEIRK